MIICTVDGWICDFFLCFKLSEPGKLSSVCLLFWVPQSQTATSSVQILRRRGISGGLWPLAGLGWCQPWSTSCLRASRKIIAKYMAAGLFRTTFRGPMPPTGTWEVSNFGWKHCQSRVGGAAERWKLSAWRPELQFCHVSLGFHRLFSKNV